MRYRQLGSSDLSVSEIALGSWLTFGVGVERDQAKGCVDRAFDVGINFIDTANVYGRGAAETFLGEALAGRSRDSYVLATKVFFPMSDTDRGLSRVQIEKQLDASLQRLRTDHIDLYQCHRFDPGTPLAETMAALTAAVRAGKVRWLGFSEWSPQNIRDALALPDVEKFVSSQPQYSLLWRRPEKEVIPLSAANGIGQDRLVAAGAGGADWQVPARRIAARRQPRRERQHGRDDAALDGTRRDRRGRTDQAARRRGGRVDGAVRAGVGVARAERRVGDYRRQPARAGRRQCGGVRSDDRPGIDQAGRGDRRCDPA